MSQVFVQTEQCWRKRPTWRDYFISVFIPPQEPDYQFITSDQLVGVLNSAAESGPDRHYVVMEEK
jgi:hypothetical protein